MKALLLIGGFGTRLRPFTLTTPKALLPVVNKPFILYQLSLLKKYGIEEVILGVGYKGHEFKKIQSIAKSLGLRAYLSFEKKPLGTAGGIRNAYKFLKGKEPFFVFNGDVLADFNLEAILDFHKGKNAYVTIGVVEVENPSAYGVLVVDENRKIEKFIEKPKEPVSNLINAGVYVFQPEVLEEIPPGKEVSVERETFPQILEKGKEMYAFLHTGYWLDVGTTDKFMKANFDVLNGKIKLAYEPKDENIEKGENTTISEDVKVDGKLITGKNCIVGNGVVIKWNVIAGDGCHIKDGAVVQDSIIFENVVIGENSEISNSVIGKEVIIGENCRIRNSFIADKSLLLPFTKMEG